MTLPVSLHLAQSWHCSPLLLCEADALAGLVPMLAKTCAMYRQDDVLTKSVPCLKEYSFRLAAHEHA
jgi:hypothetical protein